jgi:hypothetical protein
VKPKSHPQSNHYLKPQSANLLVSYQTTRNDNFAFKEVEREHAAQTSSLVELAAIMSIPHDIKRRLYVSERKKQRSCLSERSTPLVQGEVVSVFSVREIS